jgi:hypothetical protein
MGSSTQQTQQSSQTTPWAPQAGALTSAFTNAGTAYDKASQAVAPTDFTAQFTPDQLKTFQQMLGYSGNSAVPDAAGNASTAMTGAGSTATQGALSGLGSYDPTKLNNTGSLIDSANQFVAGQDINGQVANSMLPALQQARDVTMPGIEQNAAMTGNTNSTRTGIADGLVQRGLAEQAQNLGATLRNNSFNTGLQLASSNANSNNTLGLGALTGAASAGTNAVNSGVNAGSSSINDQGNLYSLANSAGAGEQAADQAKLTNEQQQFQSQTQSPYAALNGLMSIIGSNNWGGNTTGTSTTTKTPSAWDVIGGLLSAGGQAAGAAAKFSDRRVKTNIKRVGTLDNGLPVYTYQYIGNETVHMGLMAQEVELLHPEAVEEIHGIKAVHYDKAVL